MTFLIKVKKLLLLSARFQLENWSAPARLGSTRNLHSSGLLEPENSSLNSSLVSTGSTIRFWHKVKTWLDQMFWQICQKLMLSSFLSSGDLCLIHHLKLFWPHTASTASDRKGAKIQHEFWWYCLKIFFSKYWNKVLKLLNSRILKTLKSSVLIFQAIETSSV